MYVQMCMQQPVLFIRFYQLKKAMLITYMCIPAVLDLRLVFFLVSYL